MTLQIEAGYDAALLDLGFTLDEYDGGGPNTTVNSITAGTFFPRSTAASATGDHAHVASGYTAFPAALAGVLTAVGIYGATYAVSLDGATGKYTISASGGTLTSFSLSSITADAAAILGLTSASYASALTYTSDVGVYYYINSTIGFWSDATDDEEDDQGVSSTQYSHDASPSGISKEIARTIFDFTVPLEPRAIVLNRAAVAGLPWTWQALFRHCRNEQPIAVYDGTNTHFLILRDDGAVFTKNRISSDYTGHYDIPIRSQLLGRI